MSATDTATSTETEEHGGHHVGPRDYVKAALVLGVLTLMEYSTYVVDFGPIGIPLLVVLIAIKFVMVANIFMHLKFDNRLYTRLLYTGLAFAVTLYALTLLIMQLGSAPAA